MDHLVEVEMEQLEKLMDMQMLGMLDQHHQLRQYWVMMH